MFQYNAQSVYVFPMTVAFAIIPTTLLAHHQAIEFVRLNLQLLLFRNEDPRQQ